MTKRTGTAHVVTTTRKYKDKVYSTHLLRRSYREDGKVKNETLGNLSHLPDALVDLIRRSLQGETFVPLNQAFRFRRKTQSIAAEAALDGIYVIRTSLKATRMDGADCVRHYQSLARVKRSVAAQRKATTRKLEDGTPAHSFSTLMDELSTIVRNTCRTAHTGPDGYTFEVVTTANPKQRHALELIQQMQT